MMRSSLLLLGMMLCLLAGCHQFEGIFTGSRDPEFKQMFIVRSPVAFITNLTNELSVARIRYKLKVEGSVTEIDMRYRSVEGWMRIDGNDFDWFQSECLSMSMLNMNFWLCSYVPWSREEFDYVQDTIERARQRALSGYAYHIAIWQGKWSPTNELYFGKQTMREVRESDL